MAQMIFTDNQKSKQMPAGTSQGWMDNDSNISLLSHNWN